MSCQVEILNSLRANSKKVFAIVAFLFVYTATFALSNERVATPFLKTENGLTRLMVDNKPFVMLAGELHNSTSSSEEYFAPLFPKLKALNLNTLIASVAWEQFEPREGEYNYKQIDALIKHAEANSMKLVVIWFASWKNGKSSYIPLWMKRNQDKYLRVKGKDGEFATEYNGAYADFISTFCENSCRADAKAFAALMKRIKEVDKNKTVILMQVQNEVGLFQDIDYNQVAIDAYNSDVPKKLLDYLGIDKRGSWVEVFGDTPLAKEKFMAWNYATYINKIAERGKKEYDLPMFVNAWVRQSDEELPGRYPNGGPVDRVMDIYKAAAPAIDFISPDIYLMNFKETVAKYHRNDNPVFVPEARIKPENLFYTISEHDALGFAPFGIEGGIGDIVYAQTNNILKQLMPLIINYQGTGKMRGFAKNGDENSDTIQLSNQNIKVVYTSKSAPCFGLIIETAKNQYVVAGMNLRLELTPQTDNQITLIGQIVEGEYDSSGVWKDGRMLNGDEGGGLKFLYVRGTKTSTKQIDETINPNGNVAPDFYSANKEVMITTPCIYQVETYQLNK